MVGRHISGIVDRSGAFISNKLGVALQAVDGVGTHYGLDQHEDYFGRCVLSCSNAYWLNPTLAWQGSDGQKNRIRPENLPDYPNTPSGLSSETAILSGVEARQ